jgi:hypothetical protein
LRLLRITSKALGLPLASLVGACAPMSYDDSNKFLSSSLRVFISLEMVMCSLQLRDGFVLYLQRTSKSFGLPGGTPREGQVAMPYPAARKGGDEGVTRAAHIGAVQDLERIRPEIQLVLGEKSTSNQPVDKNIMDGSVGSVASHSVFFIHGFNCYQRQYITRPLWLP